MHINLILKFKMSSMNSMILTDLKKNKLSYYRLTVLYIMKKCIESNFIIL